jgi:TPR repeat protein
MKRLLILPALLLTLLVGTPAFSADWEKGVNAYQSGDYATALREWTPLAKQGHVSAQYNLGSMYQKGQGVPQDYKTAVKWYRLAAKQGYADAQTNLNIMKSRFVSKGIDECLYDEVAKITGPQTRRIVEKHCRSKMEKKSLGWLLRKFN